MGSMRRTLTLVSLGALLALAAAFTASARTDATATSVISYGQTVKIAGTVPATLRSASRMQVLTIACGFSTYTRVAQFRMPAGGRYSYTSAPTISTVYSMRAGDLEVQKRNVRVRPLVALTKVGARYRADVTSAGGTTFGGKTIVFERARSAKGPWTKVSAPKLKHTSSPTAINAVASATAPRVAAGSFLRARFPAASARPCYDGAVSAAARV
jgi:hypothetical protein